MSKGILTILTSNYPELLPDALIDRPGRFHDILNFDLPGMEIRSRMLKRWTGGVEDKMLTSIVSATKGYSGAHIFELVSFAKSLMEGEEITIEEALEKSLKKLFEQRELIEQIRGERKKRPQELLIIEEVEGIEIVDKEEDEIELIEKEEDEIEIIEKEGRVISNKNRGTITTAVSSMEKAVEALKALLSDSDKVEEANPPGVSDTAKDLELPDEEEFKPEQPLVEFDEKRFVELIKSSLSSLNFNGSGVKEIVKEEIDKAKGVVI